MYALQHEADISAGQEFVRNGRVVLSVRSVQDICNRAIGVSPKWLIRCFRLQDALQPLETGLNVNLAALARDLGYFDQAHFTRDFKQITGATPGRY